MRKTSILLLLVAIVAAACAPGEVAETPGAAAETPAPEATTPPTDTPEPAPTATTEPAEPGEAGVLAGTNWELVSFGPVGAEADVVAGSTVTLLFDRNGQAGGNSGCNSYGAPYDVSGDQISFGEVVSTLMACADDDIMDQEGRYLAALQTAESFALDGDRLTITYDGGQRVLNFVRQEEGSATDEDSSTEDASSTEEGAASLLLDELHMIDARRGWALGQVDDGLVQHILFTADAGESWQVLTPHRAPAAATEQQLEAAAYFASADEGWLSYALPAPVPPDASPRVWVTRDGGTSWESDAALDLSGMPYEHYYPSHLGFLNGQFGWLLAHLGAGMSHDYIAIFTTADGGATWQRVADPDSSPDIQACNKSGLLFTGERDGLLAGDCPGLMPPLFLYRTTDGGATWAPVLLPLLEGQPAGSAEEMGNACGVRQMALLASGAVALSLHCVDFESGSLQTWLYRSDDNGESWQGQPLPVSDGLFDFTNPTEGWLLGEAEGEPGVLFTTTDGGATWQRAAELPAQGQVDFVDATHGWILTGGGMDQPQLFRLGDDGQSWQTLDPVIAP
ncbi:MAG: META domain-containing protein [Anaerolineae bacterium]|nr:META domain-containing protein [Anaerolineae bacterium]